MPTSWIAALFIGIVIALGPVWAAMAVAAMHKGTPSLFTTIHVLDLAFVFPALVTTAIGLRRHRAWSYVLAGPLLVLCSTMMGSLVVAEVIAAIWFTPDSWPLGVAFAVIAASSTSLACAYLRAL
jgi:hypothetical protein